MSDRSPAFSQVAAAALIDAAPEVAAGAIAALRVTNGFGSPGERIGGPDAQQQQAVPGHGTPQASPRLARRIWLAVLAYNVVRAGAMVATHGRTPGTALLGLKVVRSDGAAIGIVPALARISGPSQLVSPVLRGAKPGTRVAAAAALAAANAASALIHPQRRTLGDLVAGTRVVKA